MQGQQRQTQQKRRRFPWIRAIATLLVSLLLSTAAILLLLSIEHVIADYWLVVIPIIFTVIGQLIALGQWLFPISNEAKNETPAQQLVFTRLDLTPEALQKLDEIKIIGGAPTQAQIIRETLPPYVSGLNSTNPSIFLNSFSQALQYQDVQNVELHIDIQHFVATCDDSVVNAIMIEALPHLLG